MQGLTLNQSSLYTGKMSQQPVSRRHVLTALGSCVGLYSTFVSESSQAAPSHSTRIDSSHDGAPLTPDETILKLIHPWGPGHRVRSWAVEAVRGVSQGAFSVVLRNVRAQALFLDVCLRDYASDAPKPPGKTRHFDIFVANEGNGQAATREEQGLTAMDLASAIAANESQFRPEGMLTLRQRLQRHKHEIKRH